MKFEAEDYKRFIELVNGVKVTEVKVIKKEIITYKTTESGRRVEKENLHSLAVKALSLLSKEHKLIVRIENGCCHFKVNKFKMSAPIKDWTNAIVFITMLKLGR